LIDILQKGELCSYFDGGKEVMRLYHHCFGQVEIERVNGLRIEWLLVCNKVMHRVLLLQEVIRLRERSGVEWSGVEWSGVEWSGVEWSRMAMSSIDEYPGEWS